MLEQRDSFLPNRRHVRTNAFPYLRCHPHRFTQCRMWVNGLADIDCVCAHFDREAHLANQVARMRANDAAAYDAMRFIVEDKLGEALVATVRNRATACCPLEFAD